MWSELPEEIFQIIARHSNILSARSLSAVCVASRRCVDHEMDDFDEHDFYELPTWRRWENEIGDILQGCHEEDMHDYNPECMCCGGPRWEGWDYEDLGIEFDIETRVLFGEMSIKRFRNEYVDAVLAKDMCSECAHASEWERHLLRGDVL